MSPSKSKLKRRFRKNHRSNYPKMANLNLLKGIQEEASPRTWKDSSNPEMFEMIAQSKAVNLNDDLQMLDKALTQWQLGDWENLTKLSVERIEPHFERAKLALLIAAAFFQINDLDAARHFLSIAQDWGCSRRDMSKILIAGVHNSLGCAATIVGRQPRACKHFENAISVRTPKSDLELVACKRMDKQLDQINESVSKMTVDTPDRESHPHVLIDKQFFTSTNLVRRDSSFIHRIVVAGMRHSGSTALFNIIRLSLIDAGLDYISYYSEYNNKVTKNDTQNKILLIKTHEFRDDIAFRNISNIIVTTRRDLRNTVASAVRRDFPLLKRLGNPVEYAKYNRTLHDIWLPLSDYIFVYEDFIDDPVITIRKLLKFVQLDNIDPNKIYEELLALPLDQYDVTLLTPSHITDPEQKLSFLDTLDSKTNAKINSDHSLWLNQYDYK